VRTHSSLQIDTSYGDWTVECRTCHNPHLQKNFRVYGSESYVESGVSTSIQVNQPVAGKSQLVKELAGWTDNQYQGYVLIPNVNQGGFGYKIESNTSDTITVEGVIDLGAVTPGSDTFAVIYGKLIKDKVKLDNIIGAIPPKSGNKTVKFFRNTGPNSFADSGVVYDGPCEACHTLTAHYRNDGTGPDQNHTSQGAVTGTDCTACHAHLDGFNPSAGCTDCHHYPPVDASGLVENVLGLPGTGSTTAGAHNFHVDTKNYGCESCHVNSIGFGPTHNNSLTVTMGFSLFLGSYAGGTYDGQAGVSYNDSDTGLTTVTNGGSKSCDNIYCHGRLPDATNWGGGVDTSPVWDGSVSCGDCHGATAEAPPTRGTHSKHARVFQLGYNYDCSLCHKDPVVDDSLHGNNKSEIVFSSDPKTTGGSYNGTDTALDAYGTCDNIYCHSTVQSSPPGSGPTYRPPPVWGGNIVGCGACHNFSDSGLNTGSHEEHFFTVEEEQCYTCHNWNNIDDPCFSCHDVVTAKPLRDRHANYTIDVSITPKYQGNYSGSSNPGVGYGNCSNGYCHSNGTSVSTGVIPNNTTTVWGTAGPLACDACHGNPPGYANGSPKANSHTIAEHSALGCNICHNTTTNDGVTISNLSAHVNISYNVDPGGGESFTYTYDAGGGTCSAISCHAIVDTNIWGE
jgi:predicted CxxxxCH...CXXCH cytochrome family protein